MVESLPKAANDTLETRAARLERNERHLQNANHKLIRRVDSLEDENRALRERLFRDDLTGIYNRSGLIDALDRVKIERNERIDTGMNVLLMIDLDGFKAINDKFGHKVGDKALKTVANTLRDLVRSDDIVARPSGDEFVVLLKNCTPEGADQKIDEINMMFDDLHFFEDHHQVHVRGSVGVAVVDHSLPAEVNLHHADMRMLDEKNARRQRGLAPVRDIAL